MGRTTRGRVGSAALPVAAGTPLDGYVRVSRVGGRGGESFVSPDLQEERIRAYADSRGFEIGTVYRELDRSGTDRERPQFRAVIARVAQHESGGVIVAKLDRFARSAIDALSALTEIQRAGGAFISVEDGFDWSTPFGRAMMTILSRWPSWSWRACVTAGEMAQGKAIARGVHTASRLSVGYRRGEDKRLVLDESVAPIIAEAFRRRAEGATYGEIAAIVPMRLWLAAQFGAENRVAHPKAASLLAGLIRCAGCCHVLGGSWMPLPGGRPGAQLNGYRCPGRFKSGPCPAPAWVLARDIEPVVIDRFFAKLGSRRRGKIDLELIERELTAVEAELLGCGPSSGSSRARAESRQPKRQRRSRPSRRSSWSCSGATHSTSCQRRGRCERRGRR